VFESLRLRRDEVAAREEVLRQAVRALDDTQRAAFYRDYEARLKDPDTYAVLNWFFVAGLHHFYLGKLARGAVNLGLMLLGLGFLVVAAHLGLAMLFALFIVELPALFRSQLIVANHNVVLGQRLLAQQQAGRPPR
jgi:hypothetical protein